ncbi:unnamed protein product, partial [marine sediment metagenome]
ITVYSPEYIGGVKDQAIVSSKTTASSGTTAVTVPLTYNNITYYAVVYQDNDFISSQWVDLTESGSNYFGTFGLILAGLMLMVFVLIGASQGELAIVWIIFGIIIISLMKFVDLDYYAIISLICGLLIVLYKLVSRRNK